MAQKTPQEILSEFTNASKALDDAKRAEVQAGKDVVAVTKRHAGKEAGVLAAQKKFDETQKAMLDSMTKK